MSLVITSNVSLNDRPETSNVFKPYSYRNQLLNTMKIPPNSQIALQSCKINKNGLLIVDKSNSGFAHYFGTRLGTATHPDISFSTTQPFFATAGEQDAFENGERNQRNVDDFANDIQSGLSIASFHPAYVNGVLPSKITCNPHLSTTNAFTGYKWEATQQTAKTSSKNKAKFTDISVNTRGGFTVNSPENGVVTSTQNKGFYVQNREYPISQNKGSVIFDFSGANANDKDRSPFMCGLSRINRQKDFGGRGMFMPEYYNPSLSNGQDLQYGGYSAYADICICRVGKLLKVIQVTSNSRANGTGRGQTMAKRIDYTAHDPSGKFGSEYDLKANGSAFTKCRFELDGEEIKIFMQKADGTESLLVDFTMDGSAGKNECTNPIGASKWAMYPVCALGGKGTSGNSITLAQVDHYTAYPLFDPLTYINYDWWGYSEANGLTRWCREIELRFWCDSNNTTGGSAKDGQLIPKNVNVSGGMDGYETIIITAQSEEYGDEITAPCNTQQTFGMQGSPVSVSSQDTALGNHIKSLTIPKLISNVSLFIRLNNFSQNSINARQGTLSKIIAHLPRFDNSGNETGGLYFEPTAGLIYLDLNNTNTLDINSFDIDIVYDNETLCTALSGKTICCFHIREKPLR